MKTISGDYLANNNQVAVIWKHLTVYKPYGLYESFLRQLLNNHCKKVILNDISGLFRYHDMSAIMGPSGAGKSTLLKCLFGTWHKKYKGKVFRNVRASKAAFITQHEEDHLFPCLSVLESIFYASKLKGFRNADQSIIEELLDQLDLKGCRDTYVQCCSGGQRKRLAIAQELAAKDKPKILFLDEPTSGLDSNVSFIVLTQLRELSEKNNIAIILSIHQPSYKILKLFDQLYVITKAGKCLYQGEPELLSGYLMQFQVNCPSGHNPADIAMDSAAVCTRSADGETDNGSCLRFLKKHKDRYSLNISELENDEVIKVRLLEECSQKQIEFIIDSIDTDAMIETKSISENTNRVNLYHTIYLLRRSFLHGVCREPLWIFIRTALHCFVAVVLTLLYSESIGREDGCLRVINDEYYIVPNCTNQVPLSKIREYGHVDQNVSLIFFNLLFLMFAALMPTILTFPSEINIFLNEHQNGWYSTASYYLAKTLTEFWIQLILPYFYCLFIFWSTDQKGLDSVIDIIPFIPQYSRFKAFTSVSILSSFIAQGIGFLIGSIFTTNFNISIFVGTVILLFNFLFSGFFGRFKDKNQFLTYFSFIKFAFELLLRIIYGDSRCSDHLLASNLSTPVNASLPSLPIVQSLPPLPSGYQANTSQKIISVVMFRYEIDDDIYYSNLITLFTHLIAWRLFTFIILYLKVNQNLVSNYFSNNLLTNLSFLNLHVLLVIIVLIILIFAAAFCFIAIYLLSINQPNSN